MQTSMFRINQSDNTIQLDFIKNSILSIKGLDYRRWIRQTCINANSQIILDTKTLRSSSISQWRILKLLSYIPVVSITIWSNFPFLEVTNSEIILTRSPLTVQQRQPLFNNIISSAPAVFAATKEPSISISPNYNHIHKTKTLTLK